LLIADWWLVVGGWWLVVGGWWLVVGGWWLVVGGWWLVVGAGVSRKDAKSLRGWRVLGGTTKDSKATKGGVTDD
jgi:hypothetical protein